MHIELSILVLYNEKEDHDLRVFTEILTLGSITSESYSVTLQADDIQK